MALRVEGLLRLERKLAVALQEAQRRELRIEVKRTLVGIVSKAKRNLTTGPYRAIKTGRLRNSQDHQTDSDGMGGAAGTNVEYAPHVHFGTRKMRARPWLFAAAEEERPDHVRRIAGALDRAHRNTARTTR